MMLEVKAVAAVATGPVIPANHHYNWDCSAEHSVLSTQAEHLEFSAVLLKCPQRFSAAALWM